MRGPAEDSTLPEPTGPDDERFVYHLTPEGQQLLAEHERATGDCLHEPAAPATEVADAVDRETRRRRRKARAQRARRRGRRFGTISYRWSGSDYVPALRISGKWLRQAGFDRQQEFEITVRERQLVIEALWRRLPARTGRSGSDAAPALAVATVAPEISRPPAGRRVPLHLRDQAAA